MFTFKIHTSTFNIMKVFLIGMQGYYEGRFINSKEAAKIAGISHNSLKQGYQQLLLAGIITSQARGDNPGYRIARDPKEITLLEVLKALEKFSRIRCPHQTTDGSECKVCATINRAIDNIEAEYSNITLYDYYMTLKREQTITD